MPKNEGGFGWVQGWTDDVYFSTQPTDDREHNWYEPEIHEGIEFNLGAFEEVDGGVAPTAEELYEMMGPRQKKWAKKGADWKIRVTFDEYNFKSRIGSDEEDVLMDRETHIRDFAGKVSLARKWDL